MSPPQADQVVAHPDRIEQAIENLVANALRHTPSGGTITLRATKTNGMVALSISDTGGDPCDEPVRTDHIHVLLPQSSV